MRGVKKCIQIIVDKLSLLLRTTAEEQAKLKLTFNVNVSQKPIAITPEIVAELYKPGDLNNAWTSMYM